ncbi:hypothetical protein Pth03_75950 [Planotetraspora thailandica]|uniref:HTH-like domain-containing protein n=1 Tax=Planotetraspora thailandica TaxID=487172 RepID=A0A8J4DF05_9ACTN|nr:hypothetical protein Pth03_75950 [Planotetraspora thailandica]
MRDEQLKAEITRIYQDNYSSYGARKVYRQLRREGHAVARCTVQRLMGELGIVGLVRGKARSTTTTADLAGRPADMVNRHFHAPAPNRLWVTDLTYIRTWSGGCRPERPSLPAGRRARCRRWSRHGGRHGTPVAGLLGSA